MYMEKETFVDGNKGRVFATINNRRIDLFMITEFEATAEIDVEKLPVLGRTAVYRSGDVEKKFKATMYDCTDAFNDIVLDYMETGYMPPLTLQVTNDDPKSNIGRRTMIYEGVLLDSVVLQKLDVSKAVLDTEISGTYDRVRKAEGFKNR